MANKTASETKWTKQQIDRRVCELAAQRANMPAERVGPDSSLSEDLNFDSLDTIELVMQLEDEFDVNLPDHERETGSAMPKALSDLSDAVEEKLREGSKSAN
jgi:acyl carrier protein